MAKLQVHREKSIFLSRLDISVIVDGAPLGTLANGADSEYIIGTGNHSIQCQVRRLYHSKALDFSISEDESKKMTIKPSLFINLVRACCLFMLGISFYYLIFRLNYITDGVNKYIYFFALLTLLIIVIRVFRKYFLEIREI